MDALAAEKLLAKLYRRLEGRRPKVADQEGYYLGNQPLRFATDEWRKANAARYDGFADNWCRPVVDAESERIRHTGIKLPDADSSKNELWDQWLRNEMEAQSSQGFVTTLYASRSYVLVWGDRDDNPVVTWEHPEQVEIEYDWGNRRNRLAAIKTWADSEKEYATLYTPDSVWKWERDRFSGKADNESQAAQSRVGDGNTGARWFPRETPGEVWPIANPMGVVPIVEVPNRPLLARDPISEIDGVMAMQDAVNLLWAYLFLAADFASMEARVVLGGEPPKVPVLDDQGKVIGDKPVDMKALQEKRLMYISNADAKIDSWSAARLDVFTDTIEAAVGHIAAQTRTPPNYIITKTGMSNVNGEGLKAAEIGLVKKTLEFQTFATPAIREIYRLIALAMGREDLASRVSLAVIGWANPEIRSESQLADALIKKRQMGYPLEYLMELDGIEPVEIERIMRMAAEERTDPQIAHALRPYGGSVDDSSNGGGAVPDATEDLE